jgi:hypothetical protein
VRIIIAAAGPQDKWGGYLGVPSHLAPIDGRPLLHRTVGQALCYSRDVHVTGPPGDERYNIPGTRWHERDLSHPSEYHSTRDLWSDTGRTVLVYGDVYFTDEAMQRIAAESDTGFRAFGRSGASRQTGCRYGEFFAASWWPDDHASIEQHLAVALRQRTSGTSRRPVCWLLLNSMQCRPAGNRLHRPPWWVEIDDLTEDFDFPADYDHHPAARPARLGQPTVVIPFRSDDPSRVAAFEWVREHYFRHHPTWRVVVASHDGAEFNKPAALNRAISQIPGGDRVLVIADADSFVDPGRLQQAVDAARHHPWVVVHDRTERLTEESTSALYAGADVARLESTRPYGACPGGGVFAIRRNAWNTVGGMDERFGTWGSEDQAFGRAADVILGDHLLLPGPLWHLWHKPWPRRGSLEQVRNRGVLRDYWRARTPEQMRAVMRPGTPLPIVIPGGKMISFRHRATGKVVNVPPDSAALRRLELKPQHWQRADAEPAPPTVPTAAPEQAPPDVITPPPLTGRGSGVATWRTYAARSTDTPLEQWADLTRDEIVAKLRAEGVATDDERGDVADA